MVWASNFMYGPLSAQVFLISPVDFSINSHLLTTNGKFPGKTHNLGIVQAGQAELLEEDQYLLFLRHFFSGAGPRL